ncbi:MAG: hypothetical protein V1897_09630 [Pseudomonadota bacterium]
MVSKLEGELNEKEELVNTLKKAWSDATQLKSNAEEQVSQIKNSFNDCQNQMAQMRGLLEQSKSESTRITNELESLKQELSSSNVQNRQLQSDAETCLLQLKECKDRLATAVDKKQLELPPSGDLDKSHSIIERLLEGGGSGRP